LRCALERRIHPQSRGVGAEPATSPCLRKFARGVTIERRRGRLLSGQATGFFPVAAFSTTCYIDSVLNTANKAANATAARGPFGRFYLQELINRGGMADIWLATDSNGKAFALRRLHERLRFNFLARRRFVRGAELLARIYEHPGIIGYVEHGKISGL